MERVIFCDKNNLHSCVANTVEREANWVYEIVNPNLTFKVEIDPFYFDTNPKCILKVFLPNISCDWIWIYQRDIRTVKVV